MRNNRLRSKSDRLFDTTIAGVPTIFYIILYLLPCMAGLVFSFTDFGGYSLNFNWIGFANYKKMFADPAFIRSVINYFKLYLGTLIFCFPIAFGTANILTRSKLLRERNLYRVLFFFPSTVPVLIISIMWMTMYNPSFGILNQILSFFGLPGVQWLGSTKTVMTSIIIMVIWRQFGFYLVYFMAAISNVPLSIYESARIDGASEMKQVFIITVPLCWEQIRTSMLFYIQSAINIGFDIVFITTQGGPDNASQILPSYMYQKITESLDYGMSSAIGVAMLFVTLLLAAAVLKLTKRETYEM